MALGPDLDESRSSRKTSNHQNQRKLKIFTARFRNALKKSVEDIIEADSSMPRHFDDTARYHQSESNKRQPYRCRSVGRLREQFFGEYDKRE